MKKKRAIIRVISAVIAFFAIIASTGERVYAGGEYNPENETETTAVSSESFGNTLKVKSAILIEQGSGTVLYEKNPDEPLAPASITKVMTMLLVMEAIDGGKISLNDEVAASEHACSMGGSQIWLEPGETMSVEELLKATAIGSANDAAVALAEYVSGSEEEFVGLMNERAKELGMTNTNFMNASGLDSKGHFSSARDIAKMSSELLKHEKIKDYTTVWMNTLRDGKTQLVNTNKLIRFYKGATGLKTGSTDDAGKCLAASAERNGLGVIAVVLGAGNSDDQFGSARTLLDYAFANYTVAKAPVSETAVYVKVTGGVSDSVIGKYDLPEEFIVKKGKEKELTVEIESDENVQAPVKEGEKIGKVSVRSGEETIGEYILYAAEKVEKMNFFNAFVILYGALLQ